MKLVIRFFTVMLLLITTCVYAQDEKELADLSADTASQQRIITASQKELGKYQGKVTDLLGDLSGAQEELKQANMDLSEAQRVHTADPSPANQRLLDRAESGVVLAERKVASINKRLGFSRKKASEMESSIAAARSKISANARRQDSLKGEIEAQRLASAEAKQRADELAQAKKEAKKVTVSKPKPPAPLPTPSPEPAASEPEITSEETSEIDALRSIVDEFNAYVAGDVRERGDLRRPLAYSSINGKFPLEHLGGELYFAEASLDEGEHRISVGAITYRVIVSPEEAGKPFSIYFDNRDRYKKKLITFESSKLK